MWLGVGAVVLVLVAVWQIFVHPVRALRAVLRILCGLVGIVLVLAAIAAVVQSDHWLAAAWGAVGVLLLWCANRLTLVRVR